MGFVVAGGFWKFCFKFAVDVCETKRLDVDDVRRSASRKCGANGWLERGEMRGKRGMVLLLFAGGLGFLLGLQVRRGWNRDEGDEAGSEEGGESSIHGNGCEGDGATLVHLRECFKGRTLAEGKTAKSCKVVEV
jgi:hypothetical protein